jgi:hypothetical protein
MSTGLTAGGLTAGGYGGVGEVVGTAGVHGEPVVGYGYTGFGKRTRCASEVFAMRQTLATASKKNERMMRGNTGGQDNMLRPLLFRSRKAVR